MNDNPEHLLFPHWRSRWGAAPELSSLLASADQHWGYRLVWESKATTIDPTKDSDDLVLCTVALRHWAAGNPPKDRSQHSSILARIHQCIWPVLVFSAQRRWIQLERAFYDASTSGDLLFAALTLRTMCEEFQRNHAFDLSANNLVALAKAYSEFNERIIKQFVTAAWAMLDKHPQETVLSGSGWPSLKSDFALAREANPLIELARGSLNTYVHPNYGSHIAALFPERNDTGELLLKAFNAIYGCFEKAKWRRGIHPIWPTDDTSRKSCFWTVVKAQFLSETLPLAQQAASAHPELRAVFECNATKRWLAAEETPLENHVEPLCAALPHGVLWDGASSRHMEALLSARFAEKQLVDAFPSGAPSLTSQRDWFSFNALALQLAATVNQVKMGAFMAQLVRQLTRGNRLGILLCVRSLVEHQAVALWLNTVLSKSLADLAANARAKEPLSEHAKAVAQHLANFLVTNSRSATDLRPWVADETGSTRTAWLNLEKVVSTAFPSGDRFATIYAIASAAMHGRMLQGHEATANAASRPTNEENLGLLVIERLADHEEQFSQICVGLSLFVQMDHAAKLGGTASAKTDEHAQQILGHIATLRKGVDYSGTGNESDPFRFGPHLQFHSASYALLAQLGIDISTAKRELVQGQRGGLQDKWITGTSSFFFAID